MNLVFKIFFVCTFYFVASFANEACIFWYQQKTQQLDDHGDLDYSNLPLHFLNNPSIQPSMAFYYVKESIKQRMGIVSSANDSASAQSTLGRATAKIQQIQELQSQLEIAKKDLKTKVLGLRNNSVPFKVKISRNSENFLQTRRQEIANQLSEINQIRDQIEAAATSLSGLKLSLEQAIAELDGSSKKAKTYLRNIIQLSEYISNLNSSHLGSYGVESAGVLFSLFAQEIRSAANDLALLEFSRSTIDGQRTLTADIQGELAQVESPTLKQLLQESGLSETAASEFLASLKSDSVPTTPKPSLASRLTNLRKSLNGKGWAAIVLATAIGPGYGGFQGVDYLQTARLESQISSQNPQAGKMLKGILEISEPSTRNAQIQKFVDTYQDQLSAEQVSDVADKLLKTGSYESESKKTHISALMKTYTDRIAVGNISVGFEKRAPGITNLLALVKQTKEISDANKLTMYVYQKYKATLTLEDVLLIKTYFRKDDYNRLPTSEWSAVDLDFANVLSGRK